MRRFLWLLAACGDPGGSVPDVMPTVDAPPPRGEVDCLPDWINAPNPVDTVKHIGERCPVGCESFRALGQSARCDYANGTVPNAVYNTGCPAFYRINDGTSGCCLTTTLYDSDGTWGGVTFYACR